MTKVYQREVTEGKDVFNATIADTNLRISDVCKTFISCEKSTIVQTLESAKSFRGFFKFIGEGNLSQKDEDEPENVSCKLIRSICV